MIYEQLQIVEVFSLVFSLAALGILIRVCWKTKNGCTHLLLFGYFFLVIGILFTNIESAILPRVFNLIEHIFRIMLPAMFFAKVSYTMSKKR